MSGDGVEEAAGGEAENVGIVVLHGVGETEPGWMNEFLIPRLQAHAPGLSITRHSEIYELPDKGRTRTDRMFPAYVRRARSPQGRSLMFMEFFWSDLSRFGDGPLANSLAMMKLFYEAPQVLGDGFIQRGHDYLQDVTGTLVKFANWLLRWPITGLSVAASACALVLLVRQRIIGIGVSSITPFLMLDLPTTIAVILGLLSIAAVTFALWRMHRDIALTDIGFSSAVFALVMMAVIAIAKVFVPADVLESPPVYLMFVGEAIFGTWMVWNCAIALGILLVAIMTVRRIFSRRHPVIVARAAAAVGLCAIQGFIWKIVIVLLWVFILVTMEFTKRNAQGCTPDPLEACNYIRELTNDLVGIAVFNTFAVALLVVAFFTVATVRAIIRWFARRRKVVKEIHMPRMVVSPVIIVAMYVATLFNLFIFYLRPQDPYALYNTIKVQLVDSGLVPWLVGGGTALTGALYLFRAIQHASRGILHIARDIVDHQFRARYRSFWRIIPQQYVFRGLYPRRRRIELRLDSLMQELTKGEQLDRLVFVAHSQGSVILHDYLMSKFDDATLQAIKRLDLVTLGSPLGHLYQYYFEQYSHEVSGATALHPKLSTWTNMWRVDDPIGNRVDIIPGGFIRNVPLAPGGHINYWKEQPVCEAILKLIDPPTAEQESLRKAFAAALARNSARRAPESSPAGSSP